jgi:hypothetical protein
MTRLRAQPMPEPAAVSTAASAHRFRSLRRWLELCELGLSDDRIGELLPAVICPNLNTSSTGPVLGIVLVHISRTWSRHRRHGPPAGG